MPLRRTALVPVLAFAALFAAAEARAQLQLPGAVAPTPRGGTAPSGPPRAPAGPDGSSPRVPSSVTASPLRRWDETLPGRTLRFLGQQGSLVITRQGQGYTIAVTGVGRRDNDLRNVCTPDLNGGQTVALRPLGRPDGLARFEATFSGCTLVMDLLSDVAFVSAPGGACRFDDGCVVDPSGLWGPNDREIPADREIERARGVADRRLNDARRILQTRLRTSPEGRVFLQQQAAFPANRERVCRNYGTSNIGPVFCQLKYTEARAETLAHQVGGQPAAEQPRRPHRPAPPPAAPPPAAQR
ncbi:hypothetical protein [Phreatobacter sp.]|uniref:hypothetical protein n=1 Tax=Phreatobacter sp. TaxID=1966341 RepID=UPI003F6E4823